MREFDVLVVDGEREEVGGIRLLLGYLGITVLIVGAIMLTPLLVLPFYPEEAGEAKCFILPAVISIMAGWFLSSFVRGRKLKRLARHQDALLVVTVWMTGIFLAALPFLLTGEYNLLQSLFESTSGLSTTGLSVVDVGTASHVVLMYRSILLFFGGVGLILVFTSILSDRYGMRLYNAEGHNDKVMPNLVKSARMILLIYAVYIAAGTVAYVAFGMPIFDALNHAVAAVSTGGFSTRVESIGAFDSVAIEIVTIILMILGNTNFFVHVHLFQRRFRLAFRHVELVFLGIVALIAIPVLALTLGGGIPPGETIRVAVFQFVSAITTTGFQTIPAFVGMPSAFLWLLVVFMLVGAGIGSTGGGMKQLRVAIALKSLWWNLRDHLGHPRRIAPSTILRVGNREVVDARTQVDTFSFLMLYLLVFAVGSFVFMLDGHPVGMAMFEFASCLGTVGLSVGITGFAAPGFVLATGIAGMFLGRLEIVVVVYACSRAFGRKEGIVA